MKEHTRTNEGKTNSQMRKFILSVIISLPLISSISIIPSPLSLHLTDKNSMYQTILRVPICERSSRRNNISIGTFWNHQLFWVMANSFQWKVSCDINKWINNSRWQPVRQNTVRAETFTHEVSVWLVIYCVYYVVIGWSLHHSDVFCLSHIMYNGSPTVVAFIYQRTEYTEIHAS